MTHFLFAALSSTLTAALALITFAQSAQAAGETTPEIVPVSFTRTFAPGGFDSNDRIQFVGEGIFENQCYRPGPTDVRVDEAKMTVYVTPKAYRYAGPCTQALLPFDQTVDVGILKSGNWSIVLEREGKKIGEVKVQPATSAAADDYNYAPVRQAFFAQKGITAQVVVTGEFINDCMKVKEIKATVEDEALVLQPIIEREQREGCAFGFFPYSQVVKVDNVPKGRYLLHVRSLNGNAVNSLISIQ